MFKLSKRHAASSISQIVTNSQLTELAKKISTLQVGWLTFTTTDYVFACIVKKSSKLNWEILLINKLPKIK